MIEAEHLAAEHALGLLEGEDLVRARGLTARDPVFAALVDEWRARLAPLLDRIAPVEPGPSLWPRIEAALAADAPKGEIVALRRQVRRWRTASAFAAAAAIVLALVAGPFALRPPVSAPPANSQPGPLVAALAFPGERPPVAIAFAPGRRELTIAAQGHAPARGHDDELWIIPADGKARSLGVIGNTTRRVALSPQVAALFAAGATMAVTQERPGGSPTGAAQGPVIAQRALVSA